MIYKRKWPAAVFLLPAFVFMVIFLFYPFIRNIIDSFFNVSQLGAPHGAFIGAENYLKIIPGLETTDPNMVIAVKNTLLLMACTIVFQVGIALVLALMVDTIQKGSQVFRTLFFFPIVENSYKTRLILYQQTPSIAVARVMDSSLKLAFFYFTTSKMKTHHIRLKR